MVLYKVHYPDGIIRKHKTAIADDYWRKCLPGIDKVFYYKTSKGLQYLKIVEMSEEEIWTEEIDEMSYHNLVGGRPNHGDFAYFQMDSWLTLMEF